MRKVDVVRLIFGIAGIALLAACLQSGRPPGTPLATDVPVSVANMIAAPVALDDGTFLVLDSVNSDAPPLLEVVGTDRSRREVHATLPNCSSVYVEQVVADGSEIFVVAVCPDNDAAMFGRLDLATEQIAALQEMSQFARASSDHGQLVANSLQFDRTYATYVTPRCPALSLATNGRLSTIETLTVVGPSPSWPVDRFLSGSCTQAGYIQDLSLNGTKIAVVAGSNPLRMGGCTSDGTDERCGLYLVDLDARSVRLISSEVDSSSVLLTDDGYFVMTGRIADRLGLWEIGQDGKRTLLYEGDVTPASLSRDQEAAIIAVAGGDGTSDIVSISLK